MLENVLGEGYLGSQEQRGAKYLSGGPRALALWSHHLTVGLESWNQGSEVGQSENLQAYGSSSVLSTECTSACNALHHTPRGTPETTPVPLPRPPLPRPLMPPDAKDRAHCGGQALQASLLRL